MCGIFGAVGNRNIVEDIYIGMMHLQHRGQDAAGMAVYDNERHYVHIVKDNGYVDAVMNDARKRDVQGTIGIGFTRYPTVGTGSVEEVQPFFLQHPDGIALAFNGNIVNYLSQKKRLLKNRRYLTSNCDAEVLLHVFADEYAKKDSNHSFFKAVKKVYSKIVGAYSVVGMIADKGVFAFRDPKGIRPLIMGQNNGAIAFASESNALINQGYHDLRSIMPGEAVFVDKKLHVDLRIIETSKHAHCIFEWVYFSAAESTIENKPVYTVRENLGKELAKKVRRMWPGLKPDLVIPVPDTSRPAASALATALKVPYGEGLVKNRYIGRTFIMPTQRIREHAMSLKLKPIETMIRGKKIMVVDDSIVRGTTSKKIIKLLREAGAKEVYFLSTFPPIRNPCYYGIDFQHREDLIAHDKTIPQIEKEIGADRLIYMDKEGLQRAAGIQDLCMACVTGKYVTPIKEATNLEKLRKQHIKEREDRSVVRINRK